MIFGVYDACMKVMILNGLFLLSAFTPKSFCLVSIHYIVFNSIHGHSLRRLPADMNRRRGGWLLDYAHSELILYSKARIALLYEVLLRCLSTITNALLVSRWVSV